MSQSDYIKYKKTSFQLVEQNKLKPVLSSKDYTNFKQFSFSNEITNDKVIFSSLQQPNSKNIFNIETFRTEICSDFSVCGNTNNRPNRKLNNFFFCFRSRNIHKHL